MAEHSRSSLEMRVLACLRQYPGCSDEILQRAIGDSAGKIRKAIQALLERELLWEQGELPRRTYGLTRKGTLEWGRLSRRLKAESQRELDLGDRRVLTIDQPGH
jgi:hypothetical protein